MIHLDNILRAVLGGLPSLRLFARLAAYLNAYALGIALDYALDAHAAAARWSRRL